MGNEEKGSSRQTHAPDPDRPLAIPKVEREGKLILVIERDPFYRLLMEYFLHLSSVEVEFVPDGILAMKRVKLRKPDLVILDVVLPKVDGLTLCRHFRGDEETKEVPILVFTVLDMEQESLAAGATAFLRKPFEEQKFRKVILQFIPSLGSGGS